MAEIDPSILQRFTLANNAPALNMFQNALTAQKNRERQDFEMEQAAAQAPFKNRLLESQAGVAEEALTEDQQKNRLRSIAEFTSNISGDVQRGDLAAVKVKVGERIADLTKQELPTAESRQMLDLIDNPAIDDASKLAQLDQLSKASNQLAMRMGVLEPAGGAGRGSGPKSFAPIPVVKKDADGNVTDRQLVFPTVTDGVPELKQAQIPEGFELPTETAEEKRTAELLITRKKEGEKVTGKGQAQRRETDISKGLEAADGYANLARAKDLLGTLETGGIDSVSLRAKQLFGVEGADEAELSNRMGKAVLSQLKATFGAAFTAKEGESLDRIEANYGKSTEGNKRLIDQTIKIVERVAKRGIRAAVASEDFESAQEIKEALAFRLDVGGDAGQPSGAAPTQPQVLKFNPATGRLE